MADVMYEEDDENDPVSRIYKLRKEASKHQHEWKNDAYEDFAFRDGQQWDSEDVAILEQQKRPVVTFNRCSPIIESIVGHEVGNRQEVRYFPRTMGDRAANEVYTEGARWVRQECDAEDEESEAYKDSITCGMGWTEYRVEYDEEPDGKIVIERVSPLEMKWDPSSRKQNLVDANWILREKWMDVDEARERWPEKDILLDGVQEEDRTFLDEHDATESWKYENDQRWYDKTEKKVRVIQFQEREREDYYRVMDPQTGQPVDLSPERFEALEFEGDYVKLRRWVYKQCFIAGRTMVEEGKPPIDGFSFFPITGKRDEVKGIWYGIMRGMKDPQRWANKFFSQAMYIFSSNAKGGLIAERTAVDDKQEFEDSWASPDSVNWVEDGAVSMGRIKEKDMGGYPASLDKLLQFAIASIRDVSGVNLELLGMADREQAGVLEVERKKAALVILAPLLASLRRYRKISGRALLAFMRRYIPPGTMMRLTDKAVPFYPDDDVIKYDVVIDTAANSPNLKQEVWAQLTQIVPALVKAGVPLPPDLIRFSPLPESVAEGWIEYMGNQGKVAPEVQKRMEELQQQVVDLENQNKALMDKRQGQMAQLQSKREEMALEKEAREQQLAFEAQKMALELEWKAKMADADRAAKLLDIQARSDEAKAQCALDREIAQMKLMTERDGMSAKMEMEREMASRKMEMDLLQIREKREEKFRTDAPKTTQLVKTTLGPELEPIRKTLEHLEQLASEAQERRERIMAYLESQGAADAARRLN